MSLQNIVALSIGIACFVAGSLLLKHRAVIGSFVHTVMSKRGAETVLTGSSTGSAPVVLPRQHQVASAPVLDFEAVLTFLTEHNLTDEQAIDLFATAHRAPDDYFISANKLRDAIGGNEAAVKAQVAARRPKPPAPRPAARLERPVNGW